MGLFGGRKSGVDVIDFTKTRSGKPIAKKKEPQAPAPFVGGFLDFTQNSSQAINSPSTEQPSTFGFLNDFAQSASNSNTDDVTSRFSSPDAEVSALRLKVDDLEYKIERLLERLATLETQGS